MPKSWRIIEQDPKVVEQVSIAYGLDPLLVKCLLNRGVDKKQGIESFLQPQAYESPDPFLMPDMDIAVDRIEKALSQGERICIYGDYDADGVTAIAILMLALEALDGNVFYYIPDRFFEGVGLHTERLRKLRQEENVGLVITVDTGIRAFDEMTAARGFGLDVIVTDHHSPGDQRPEALAVLNPKIQGSQYPFHGLSGAGVAFKLAQALDSRFPGKLDLNLYVQIACIGTIADMVPLLKENRWLVAKGLQAVNRAQSGPINLLLRRLGIRGEVNALDISFKVAPRINAPGRLGDPDVAISFFLSKNPRETARIVEIMDGMNGVRQMLERDLESKIELQLKYTYREPLPAFILVAGRHWHRGILGIMACKILRRFNRPVCVLSFDDHGAHGSLRSIHGVNILEPLSQIRSLLNSYGGHPEAAGISLPVNNISQFRKRMNEILEPAVARAPRSGTPHIDAEIPWAEVDRVVRRNLTKLAPFGIGNQTPVFLTANLILESELLRKGPWFHFEASDGMRTRKCSFYHPPNLDFRFEKFDSVDLVYSLTPFRDEFQVQIVEMRPSDHHHE